MGENILDYPCGPSVITKVYIRGKERGGSESEKRSMIKEAGWGEMPYDVATSQGMQAAARI